MQIEIFSGWLSQATALTCSKQGPAQLQCCLGPPVAQVPAQFLGSPLAYPQHGSGPALSSAGPLQEAGVGSAVCLQLTLTDGHAQTAVFEYKASEVSGN